MHAHSTHDDDGDFLPWKKTTNKADRAADVQRETMKKKRRELEQVSLDAASDMLDTDSNATFAMVSWAR